MRRACLNRDGELIICTIQEAVENNYPVVYNSETTAELIRKGMVSL